MAKEVVFVGPRQVEVREYEERAPGPREIQVRNRYSSISHGTERSHYRGEAIWHRKRVEADGFVTDGFNMQHPFTYGYEDVAAVVAIGPQVTEVQIGDMVACSAHHRETRIFNLDNPSGGATGTAGVAVTLSLPVLPKDDNMDKYVFISLGTVALDAVLLGAPKLGESVVVIGQGVVGLLTTQMCKLAGADPVIAVDLVDSRLKVAKNLGADYVFNPKHGDVGREVQKVLGGHGADVCFECSGSAGGIGLALHCGTPFPIVICEGMYDGPATDLHLGEEFCRSAGQILHSRAGGFRLGPEMGAENSYYHRKWDLPRVTKTVINLLQSGKLNVDGLISHRFRLEQAKIAYELIDQHPEQVTKVIFDLTL